MIRSLDTNLQQALAEGEGFLRQAFSALAGVGGGSLLDIQLYNLQRKYLDYQVNIGNRIIEKLQSGDTDAAQQLSQKSLVSKILSMTCSAKRAKRLSVPRTNCASPR